MLGGETLHSQECCKRNTIFILKIRFCWGTGMRTRSRRVEIRTNGHFKDERTPRLLFCVLVLHFVGCIYFPSYFTHWISLFCDCF